MRSFLASLCIATCLMGVSARADDANVVNLYSAQQEQLIRPLLDAFTKETGIKVNLMTLGASELVTKLEHEGKNSPADLMMTADIGNIYQVQKRDLFKGVKSEILEKNIPAHLRDSGGKWFGLTMRARTLFVRKDDKPKGDLDYLDLAKPEWKGKVLIRSSDNVYNQSLMSYMIYHYGVDKATKWAKGLVANLARKPQAGDREQLAALAAGEGDIAVANTYYYGMLVAGDKTVQDEKVKENVAIVFPDQDDIGTHVNIRGGGVLKTAKHEANAVKLLEFLSQPEAQKVFAGDNFEYPVNPAVKPSEALASWEEFKGDTTPLGKIGGLQSQAIRIMDEVGWK
jgi:iron(III) transport system substrate-binding protein